MSVSGKLAVKKRTQQGSRECARLRGQGLIPGNLYGHKQDNVFFAASTADVLSLIRAGIRVLDLDLDGQVEKVLFREIQWDSLGNELLHVDLLRVDPNEKLEVEVKVELKGTAPGTLSGGILDHSLRTLHLECSAIEIPDSIIVKIGTMEVGHAIHVRELEIPPNTRVLNNPDDVVVRIALPGAEKLETPTGEEGAQPEVIGAKKPAEGEEAAAAAEKKK
ncbi:MAG: 50S ribosomal protein L25 [Planctomycetes bacterium]|nr:50S ribosomal protein L25 [Planctomycetota bacterium]